MIKASIVSIGNELLSGQTVDTNAAYLGGRLFSASIPVVGCFAVGDDVNSIVRSLTQAANEADVVLATGGLGPTDDDLTRQAFAELLDSELQLDNELLERIEKYFTSRNLQMSVNNRVQAYIPAGAKPLANNLGTAPGIMAEMKGKLFAAMPGVPSEMKAMFEESVFERLKQLAADTGQLKTVVRKVRCFGAGESTIAELLGDVCQRGRNPLINYTVEYGVITLHIIATAENEEKALQKVEKDEELLRNILGELVYGTGDQSLAEVAGQKLTEQEKTVAVAESCTGGTLAKLLTDIPGASRYFTHGWVTYSNEAKSSELGIPGYLIEKYGAVSEQVAEAMAQGARKKSDTDFAIAITGIAGPTGGTEQKGIGLVYISIDSDAGCETRAYNFSHDRQFIRLRTAQTALNMLRLKLQID